MHSHSPTALACHALASRLVLPPRRRRSLLPCFIGWTAAAVWGHT
jgi:hypothetical protein